MFSAYTIKKVLPRLVIATIAIQLSWWICIEVVKINNNIAHGIEGLFYAPFGGYSAVSLQNILKTAGAEAQKAYVGTATVGAISFVTVSLAAGPSTALGVLALAGTAILGAFIALFTLVLRKVVLIALIVTAPIGIVAWVLPGTEKLWKLWYESFSKLLLMYPLILMIIAAGHIFAYIAAASGGNNQFFTFLIITIGFFGPYFLIPATLKLSGAAFATITGVVNSKGKGAFDRLRNIRSSEAQKTWQKTKNYERFGDKNRVARGASTAFGALVNPKDAARGRAGIRAGRRTGITNLGADNWKNDATIQANQNDDGFLLALANENLAVQKITAAKARRDAALAGGDMSGANAAQKEMDSRSASLANARRVASRNSASTRMAATMALAKTGYQFSAGEEGYKELDSTIRSITGGDEGAHSHAMNEAQYHLKNAGRADMGGINHGAENNIKSGVRKLGNYQRGQGKTDTYYGGAEAWLGHGSSSSKTSAEITRDVGTSMANPDSGVDGSSVAEWHSMLLSDLPSATDANKLEIQKQIDAIEGLAGQYTSSPTSGLSTEEYDRRVAFIGEIEKNKLRARQLPIDPSELEK